MNKKELERAELILQAKRIFADVTEFEYLPDDALANRALLVKDILREVSFDSIKDKDIMLSKLMQACNSLTFMETVVLDARFGFDGTEPMSRTAIAKKLELTYERIRQIEVRALRRLRHPSRMKFVISREASKAQTLNEEQSRQNKVATDVRKDTDLTEFPLSVRAYNCLTRAGINTLGELLQTSEQELFTIRNLGKKSYGEVLKLKYEYKDKVTD